VKYSLIPIIILLLFSLCNISTKPDKDSSENNPRNEQISQKTEFISSIQTPNGYTRTKLSNNSFGTYLRQLKLKQDNNVVYLYNGEKKRNQNAQFLVLQLDVGNRDLQQCADAVMRLRAEYLYTHKRYDEIHFNFVSDGKPRYYTHYIKGDTSYKTFRKYMNYIFSYANTASLLEEMQKVENRNDITIGNVFIQKGKPYGHAVIVVDEAVNNQNQKIFMIAQSFMPAQEIHILKNPTNKQLSPWYTLDTNNLITPEWTFLWSDLRKF
jgi:hypothetical protein